MDYKEQQEQELEALESIFSQEFKLLNKEPLASFEFELKTSNYDSNPKESGKLVLKFTYTKNYPDELVQVEILESQNFYDDKDTITTINTIGSDNLGMPMVYTIILALMEKMEAYNDTRIEVAAETKARLEREHEMEELRRFEGTKVNVESFFRWKQQFDQEMNELKKVVDVTNKKLTGKQLFERNDEFVNSDLQFIAGEDSVEVDETLFQNLEGLEIDAAAFEEDEDDEDDEDYEEEDDDDDDEEDDE